MSQTYASQRSEIHQGVKKKKQEIRDKQQSRNKQKQKHKEESQSANVT